MLDSRCFSPKIIINNKYNNIINENKNVTLFKTSNLRKFFIDRFDILIGSCVEHIFICLYSIDITLGKTFFFLQ